MAGLAHALGRVVRLVLPVLAFAATPVTVQATSPSAELDVREDTVQLVDRFRVDRTSLDYVYRVDIANSGAAFTGVTAEVGTSQAGAQIVDGAVIEFGEVGAGEQVTSLSTFTIRVGRRTQPDVGQLSFFNIQADPVVGEEDTVAPEVVITAPAPLSIFSQPTTDVSGTVDDPEAVISVNGVSATVSDGEFLAEDVPLVEGPNTLTATARDAAGNIGLDSVQVSLDTTAPTVSILAPTPNAILPTTQVTVVGNVNDIVSGTVNADDVTVTVNGVEARVVNRSYEVQDLLLVRGANTISVVARDQVGNEATAEVDVEVQDELGQQSIRIISGNNQSGPIGSELPEPLVVEATDADGQVIAGLPVTFSVLTSDGTLTAFPESGREVTVVTDEFGRASAFFRLGSRSGVGNNTVGVTAPGVVSEVIFCLSSEQAEPAQINAVSGENQRGVGGRALPLPFQVVVTDFGGNPLQGVAVDFEVLEGGGNIGGQTVVTRETDSNGETGVIFTLGEQTGINNNLVSATIQSLPDSQVFFQASSFAPETSQPTTLVGVVLDNAGGPIPCVRAEVISDDNVGVSTRTDVEGRFELTDVPIGNVHLLIDPTPPDDPATECLPGTEPRPETFTFLAFTLTTFPGVENSLGMPISLPILDPDNQRIVGGDEDVVLTMEGVEGFAFTVFANSTFDAEGNPTGPIPMSLNQVHANQVPMPPPDGTSPITVWTLQPAGIHFDPPVKVQLPNADGLAPGTVVEILSFDHDLEQFVSVGLGRVSEDGDVITSDPGFGITKSGWGTPQPPPPPDNCTLSCNDRNECTSDSLQDPPCRCSNNPTNEGGSCGGEPGANACRVGECQGGACVGTVRTEGSCDDGLFCTENDQCTADGGCEGTPKDEPFPVNDTFQLGAINKTLEAISKWLSLLKLGGVNIPPLPNLQGSLSIKTEEKCCEQAQGALKEKSTITGTITFPTYDTGKLIPRVPPWSGDYTFTVFGREIGAAYGVFIQLQAGVGAGLSRAKDECPGTVCWGGDVQITGSGSGGVTGFVPNPASAADACGAPGPRRPCNLIDITGQFTTGLNFGGAVSCEKIEGGVRHNGVTAGISITLAEGSWFEVKAGRDLVLIDSGLVTNLSISLPL